MNQKVKIPLHKIPRCPYPAFWIIITILYASVFTYIDFSDNPFDGFKGFATIIAQAGIVTIAVAGLLGLISINRLIFAITYPPLILASSILAYYHATLGVSFTGANIEIMMENDMTMWSTVITFPIILTAMISLIAAVAIVIYRWKCVDIRHTPAWLIAMLLLLLVPLSVHKTFKAIRTRSPFVLYYSIKDYIGNKQEISAHRDQFSDIRLERGASTPDIVVVLGEALRPDHLGINGYERNTTPLLGRDSNVVSYPRVETEHYHTFVSIPNIMTRSDSRNPERGYEEESFITLFKRMGYATYWLSNQDMMRSYAYFMHEADSLRLMNPGKTIHNFIPAYDLDLLPYTDQFLRKGSVPGRPRLLVMHTIGSHWVYNYNYPDTLARFKPEINSRIISELTDEQLINSYDNTVIATDLLLSELIKRYADRNAFIVYISDHGEALGEDGKYLHGFESPGVRTTACIFWYSKEFAARYPKKVEALKSNKDAAWLTDIIFHTVIDAADFQTGILDESLSILRKKPHNK